MPPPRFTLLFLVACFAGMATLYGQPVISRQVFGVFATSSAPQDGRVLQFTAHAGECFTASPTTAAAAVLASIGFQQPDDRAVTATRAAEKAVAAIRVFPNPVTSRFTVDLRASDERFTDLQLLDIFGRVVLHQDLPVRSGLIEVNRLTHLPAGTYLLRIRGGVGPWHTLRPIVKTLP